MRMPKLNRHVVGAGTLLAVLVGLGLIGDTRFARDRESLDDVADASALLAAVQKAPPETYGSVSSIQPRQSVFSLPSTEKWTANDWQAAADAVEKLYSGKNKQAAATTLPTKLVWQPPQEIAGKNGQEKESAPSR